MLSRQLSCRIVLDVREPADLLFSVAVAAAYPRAHESLTVAVDGTGVEPVEVAGPQGTRLHQLYAERGTVELSYAAEVQDAEPAGATPYELIEALRPSRYCDSDRMGEIARSLFGSRTGHDLARAGTQWILDNIYYAPGSSGPTDGALDTFVSRRGVCRDSAQLLITFLRACDLPARMVSCYAPGLRPMDFHAVVEAYVDGAWHVLDGTGLAPRPSLVRIATGRDAADTAFLTVQRGRADLVELAVDARLDGDLPADDGMRAVILR